MRSSLVLLAALAALSGCIEGTPAGWVATARFNEPLDTAAAMGAGERLGWDPSSGLGDDGAGVGFNVSAQHSLRYGTGSSVGYGKGDRILEARFRFDEGAATARTGGEATAEGRDAWRPVFEHWLHEFERETGWTADGVRWTRTYTH